MVILLCVLCLVFSAVHAAPSRSDFRALMQERIADHLPLHHERPFPSREDLLAMPHEALADLVASMSGVQATVDTPSQARDSIDDFNVGWPPVWPYPKAFTNGTTSLLVSSTKLQIRCTHPTDELTDAFKRAIARMFPHKALEPTGSPVLTLVDVTVDDMEAELQLETDESYTLAVNEDGSASLHAKTQVGVLHGLETLSQLVVFDFDNQTYFIPGTPWTISDEPRFKHREILIDTSRHFLPVSIIEQITDSLSYAKLNVLHWHIVDSPSFPMDSPSYPRLSRFGSFSPQERYSPLDIAHLVDYARQRAVRVMVEIDMPGHAQSWCAGHPEICPAADCQMPLNPATNKTFDLIAGLLKDLTGGKRGAGVMFENLLHLGGDEVNTGCWTKSPSISAWMAANNFTEDTAYYYFVGRAQEIARNQGRDAVGWEEIWRYFGTKLDKSTIIHQWLPKSTAAQECIQAGYRALWSTDGVWYLDGLKVSWQTMYQQEPCTNITDVDCAKYMLGGGGEMWGETADPSDVLQTIWPRAAAVAERLWSPRAITDINDATPRLMAFRCLLTRRGVPAAPSTNPIARSAPSGPGSCYLQ